MTVHAARAGGDASATERFDAQPRFRPYACRRLQRVTRGSSASLSLPTRGDVAGKEEITATIEAHVAAVGAADAEAVARLYAAEAEVQDPRGRPSRSDGARSGSTSPPSLPSHVKWSWGS